MQAKNIQIKLAKLPSSRCLIMVEESNNLVFAPTWAVASVYFVFIISSLIAERIIFKLGQVWRSRKQFALFEALEKIKEELMVVGFISLALAVGSTNVTKICVPMKWSTFFSQCKKPDETHGRQDLESTSGKTPEEICSEKGKAAFMDANSLHQLHIFIFILAVVHVVYSVLTMALGLWRVHRWKHWEQKSSAMETMPSAYGGIRLTKDATFIKRHVAGEWSKNIILSHMSAFLQQFYRFVSFTDYRTLRHGFIKNHSLEQTFDFHEYIMRSMEKDFKHVIGISPPLWGYLVVLTLFNVEGWGMLYWTSLIPFFMVLIVGTKLRHIITQMAILCLDKHAVIENIPAVKPSDDLFWFRKPRLILSFIHYILFQDALEVSVHIWSKFSFENSNCLNRRPSLIAARIILGLVAQILCGYVVLPIYALVSQMGSQMKKHDDMELGVHEDKSVGANVDGHMEGEGGEESIKEVKEGDAYIQRKMSYNERVARGVCGEDYYKLQSSTPSGHDRI